LANTGYDFAGWEGAGSGRNVRTVVMSSDQILTAKFDQQGPGGGGTQTYSLNLDITTNAAKTSGKCSVTQPKGGLGAYDYDAGTSITITTSGSAPFVFQGWRERNAFTDISAAQSYTFTINKNTELIARYIDTTTPAEVKYCRFEGGNKGCYKIDPTSSDPEVTKTEAACTAKDGEVVTDCLAPANGVYCLWTQQNNKCAWKPGTSAEAAAAACRADPGTVVESCP
jgi:hypothetical protein